MLQHVAGGPGRMPWPVLKPLSREMPRPIRIGRPVCILGAHSRVHLPLRSSMVSRAHALIVIDEVETYVRDLASRNGVYVNGSVVREARLRNGDLLCIGPFAFRWNVAPPPGPRQRHLAPPPRQEAGSLFITGEPTPRPIDGRTLLIGQRPDCDIVLRNSLVEAAHAVVYRRASQYFLRDLNSTTGTFVNSRRTREAQLHAGDEIRIGLTFLRFEPCDAGRVEAPGLDGAPDELTDLAGIAAADLGQSVPTIEQLLGVSAAPGAGETESLTERSR